MADSNKIFNLIENYIYMYHTDTFIILPAYPESIQDSLPANFASTTPLLRTAPIYAYTSSGPRSFQISLTFRRDMMTMINYKKSNAKVEMGDDYVDTLIKQLQAVALPKMRSSERMVDPPIVAVRFGDDIYCKGVINGGITITYGLPIIHEDDKDKYSQITIGFQIYEIEPQSADTVMQKGGFRGLDVSLERNLWKGA